MSKARCPDGRPHYWLMEWIDGPTPTSPREYWQTCKNCGKDARADETLGLGRNEGSVRFTATPAVRDEPQRAAKEDQVTETEFQLPEFPKGTAGNMAKGRFYQEHTEEIRGDVAALGPDHAREKWGMSRTTLGRYMSDNPPRKLIQPRETPKTLLAAQNAQQVPQHMPQHTLQQVRGPQPDNGHATLPPWSNDWASEVQVAWLRALAVLALAGKAKTKEEALNG